MIYTSYDTVEQLKYAIKSDMLDVLFTYFTSVCSCTFYVFIKNLLNYQNTK